MADWTNRANAILQKGLSNDHVSLHSTQLEVLENIIGRKKNVLYIDKTGAGKSETYFVLTKLLRESNARAGPVIVVTPLVALISDQVRRANAFGLRAFGFYSAKKGMTDLARSNILKKLQKNEVDLLYITAEMLSEISSDYNSFVNERGEHVEYQPKLLQVCPALRRSLPLDMNAASWDCVPMIVIDEIHYISDAGHDFRVDYATVWSKFTSHSWFINARKLGITATVTKRIQSSLHSYWPDIQQWVNVLGNLYRENIALRVQPKPANDTERLDYVRMLYLKNPNSSILVFCKSIKNVLDFKKRLEDMGVPGNKVGYYFSPTNRDQTTCVNRFEEDFRKGTVQVLFTTCALGLGYDKSDIQHVVHMWTPNSIVQYYQEFGRAGRSNGNQATAHLLPTNPWNPSGWADVLSSICWALARAPNNSMSLFDINARGGSLGHKQSDIARAIELGLQKNYFNSTDGTLILRNANSTLPQVDKIFAEQMKEEVDFMSSLSKNCGGKSVCLWNFVLEQFLGKQNPGLTCGKCSGLACVPGANMVGNPFAEGSYFYRLTAKHSKTPIFAFSKVGDELMADDELLKDIFALHFPSMVTEPPGKWTICSVPDSANSNISEANEIATWLNKMEVNTEFIKKNPSYTRSVKDAKSQQERLEILQNKFIFDWDKAPTVGNVLLYDDMVSSGDTIDFIVTTMRNTIRVPMEIVALTKFVFIGSKITSPEVLKLNLSNLNQELAQSAQP